MKRMTIFFLLIAGLAHAASQEPQGRALQTVQTAWQIADSTTSDGTEPTALSVSERTKLIVDALIAAGASGDDEISVFRIPPKWNGMAFKGIGITADTGTMTHQIYFGTLGTDTDCEISHSASLAWTMGKQDSTYHQIAFTSGGTYIPQKGDTVTGNTSGETAVVDSLSALTSGTWAGGDAAGTITYRSKSGTFTNSETVTVTRGGVTLSTNALTHAASDLVDFEFADTLVLTATKTWSAGITWKSASPADDTDASAEIDVKGADIMIVLTSAANNDCKLLVKGY